MGELVIKPMGFIGISMGQDGYKYSDFPWDVLGFRWELAKMGAHSSNH